MLFNTLRKDCYFIINQRNVEEVHLEILSNARRIADALGGKIFCVGIGGVSENSLTELATYGADVVYSLTNEKLPKYNAETSGYYVEFLLKLIETDKPGKVFFTDSLTDRDLACRLAARMRAAFISRCIAFSSGNGTLSAYDKAIYQGKITGTFTSSGKNNIEIITVKPGSMEKVPCDGVKNPEKRFSSLSLDVIKSPLQTLGTAKAEPEQITLDEADIIITGGRGMGSAENFSVLHKLAKLLGGTVAGSLGSVDEGWIPRMKLVGQTGMTVEPKLYIACGVSGSIYHLMGMRDSKAIVAINKDRYAPIFKYADFGIVGDVMEVIPSMIESLEQKALRTTTDKKI